VAQVELKVTAVRCIHRAAALPFELSDASRSEAQVKAAEVPPALRFCWPACLLHASCSISCGGAC
jgi:hypothetical protein